VWGRFETAKLALRASPLARQLSSSWLAKDPGSRDSASPGSRTNSGHSSTLVFHCILFCFVSWPPLMMKVLQDYSIHLKHWAFFLLALWVGFQYRFDIFVWATRIMSDTTEIKTKLNNQESQNLMAFSHVSKMKLGCLSPTHNFIVYFLDSSRPAPQSADIPDSVSRFLQIPLNIGKVCYHISLWWTSLT
jgi:hypothetical protein